MAIDPNFATQQLRLRPLHVRRPDRRAPRGPGEDATLPTAARRDTDGCIISGRLSRLTGGRIRLDARADASSTTGASSSRATRSARSSSAPTATSTSPAARARASTTRTGASSAAPPAPPPRRRTRAAIRPSPVGGAQTKPTAEGGALRAQSPRRAAGEPRLLNGSILRLDPATGAGAARQPAVRRPPTPNERRIIGYGLPQSVPHDDPARHQRDLDRRRRLERLGGDQPDSGPATGPQLRLALLRRATPPSTRA